MFNSGLLFCVHPELDLKIKFKINMQKTPARNQVRLTSTVVLLRLLFQTGGNMNAYSRE